MKIRIEKDWDSPDIFRQTPGFSKHWEEFEFTESRDVFADVLLVLNAPPRNIWGFFRKGGRIIMSQEPPHEFYQWQTKYYKYFDRAYSFWSPGDFERGKVVNLQTCLPWHVGLSYDELMALDWKDMPQKKDEVSWITSNLNNRPGHTLRLAFLDYLKKAGFPFALYGRGFQPIEDKFNGIAPFKYSIAIENYACNDYWTEKIADAYLSWTMPIYFGCRNIQEYFPAESYIAIDPTRPDTALETIQKAIADNAWEKSLPAIAKARQLILNEYQLFPALAKRVREMNLKSSRRSFFFIPK